MSQGRKGRQGRSSVLHGWCCSCVFSLILAGGKRFLSLFFYFTCVLKLEIGFDAVVENVSLLLTLCGISRMFFLYSLQSGSLVFYVFLILTKKRFLVAENRGQICFFLHS